MVYDLRSRNLVSLVSPDQKSIALLSPLLALILPYALSSFLQGLSGVFFLESHCLPWWILLVPQGHFPFSRFIHPCTLFY